MALTTRVWGAGKVLLLVGALFVTYGLFAAAAMRVALRAREVVVPSLAGRTVNDASAILADSGLNLKVEEGRRPDPKVPAGQILSQDPQPGVSTRRERSVKVWVSAGPRSNIVPALTGESDRAAETRVRQDGLITADEVNTVRAWVGDRAGVVMPEYVRVLANKVVNGDRANEYYQGLLLRLKFQAGPAQPLELLVNKWFLGLDRPFARLDDGMPASYRYAEGVLFNSTGGPSLFDIKQGGITNCGFMSALGAAAVIGEDGVRDHRGRRVAALGVDPRLDAVRRQHLDRRGERGFGERVRVHADEERAGDAGLLAIEADGLGDRQDVPFVEGGGEGGAAMARRA